jgi:hypothetical protein
MEEEKRLGKGNYKKKKRKEKQKPWSCRRVRGREGSH